MDQLAERLVQVRPSRRQLAWQELEFEAFIHFGVNTFTDREWGTGQESPSVFAPTALDTDQWCESMKAAGIRGCIITAKHHDGFCLWDTAYTDHSVMYSPYGEDIVEKLSESCRKYGIKLGIYLSPWDRHDSRYGQGEPYNDYFCNQLRELGTRYGDIYTFWFDGACGEGQNGKKQGYDWDRYYTVIRECQPEAAIAVCGPDVRWCGNEAGDCRESEWSVVSAWMADAEKIQGDSQMSDDASFREQTLRNQDRDLGSREVLKNIDKLIWYPAQVNVSIRPGWFYHSSEDAEVKSLESLLHMYEQSVGGNANFLLNLPPDTRGLIHEADTARLKELGAAIEAITAVDYTGEAAFTADREELEHPASNIGTSAEGYWKPVDGQEQAEVTVSLGEKRSVSALILMEEIAQSQRIEAFTVSAMVDGKEKEIFRGTTVGYKKICRFDPVFTERVMIKITASRVAPTLRSVKICG